MTCFFLAQLQRFDVLLALHLFDQSRRTICARHGEKISAVPGSGLGRFLQEPAREVRK